MDILFPCRPEDRKKGMLPSGRASLRASPFIRKYQRLVLDYGVPIAVLHDMVAVSNEDFTFADSDIGRVKLIERAAFNGDSGSIVVIAVQRPSRVDTLKVPPSMVIFALSSA